MSLRPGSIQFGSGSAQVDTIADGGRTLSLALSVGVLVPEQTLLLTLRDQAGDSLVLDAPPQAGRFVTSLSRAVGGHAARTIALTISLAGGVPRIFVSHSGECSIALDRADAGGVAGSFRCSGMQGTGGRLSASGRISASP